MLMLNPFQRSLCIPGKLGACLVTGTDKVRSGYGNGDCLLLDVCNAVFAVADATERFPQASRILLERLAAEIAAGGAPASRSEFEALLDRVWTQQHFIHKTTLSCIVLLNKAAGPAAMLANNGDSSITVLKTSDGTMEFRTTADMNFAGRSSRPNPVSICNLDPSGATIILATDGLSDIGDIRGTEIVQKPDHLAQWICGRKQDASQPSEIDDIGAIALTTNGSGPSATTGTFIMGGTRPGEETDFSRSARQKPAMDRWDSIAAWREAPELTDLAGIHIR